MLQLSVCIISNKVDKVLFDCINAVSSLGVEICIGLNQIPEEAIGPIQEKYPNCQFFLLEWAGYGQTKNQLALKAKNDWILSIDADEICTKALIQNLAHSIPLNNKEVVCFKRVNYLGDRRIKHGAWGSGSNIVIRLYHRTQYQWDEKDVHEQLYPKPKQTILIKGELKHYTAKSLKEVKAKNDQYAHLSATRMYKAGKKGNSFKTIVATIFTFLKQYFLQRGFLDGKVGLLLALENARYTYNKYKNLQRSVTNKTFGKLV